MKLYNLFIYSCVFISLCLVAPDCIVAQCINTFPYVQDFEASQGGWTAGGVNNDWAWGAPSKPIISHAGSGSKCWVVGGLTASFYNYSERSYVESPCFDFTNLQYPYIQFLIFWQSERDFDGTNLQYSLDGGTTWTNVGDFTDPVNCLNENWYNEKSITYIQNSILENGVTPNPKSAWCGNDSIVGVPQGICHSGDGLQNWVTAKHCMSYLAGKPSVMFRFTFGAGTTCNNYDGMAFDSVAISDAPPNSGSFTYVCVDSVTVSFSAAATLCPTGVLWNFNDSASGAANTSTSLNPTHTYSTPSTHTATLMLSGPCNAPDTITETFSCTTPSCALSLNLEAQSGSCNGGSNGGSITANVTGGSGAYSYNWSNGATTPGIADLSSGTYTVTVATTSPPLCSAIDSAAIANIPSTGSVVISPHAVTIDLGQTTTLTATTTNTLGVLVWTPLDDISCDTCTIVTVGPPATMTYYVMIPDSAGCIVRDSAVVTVIPDYYIYIPNVFAPTGFNSANYYFQAFIRYPDEMEYWTISVFDRWGEKVYESNDMNFQWDGTYKGKPAPMGVYVYVAKAVFLNGHEELLKGSVTILR